jgi:multiple sugar transport system substrate-binding protein
LKRSICGILAIIALGAAVYADEAKTVRMWTFLNPVNATSGRNLALKKIIDKFEAENPSIKIAVEPQQWDVMTQKFIAAHQAGDAPDIQWALMDMMGEVLEAKAFADLEGLFLKGWSAAQVKDVQDAFWDLGVRDGKHYQVALSRNYFGIMYRADLFREKGIKTPFKSIDELTAAAQKLTGIDAKTGLQRYGLGMAFSKDKADPPLATALITARQGSIFDKSGKAAWTSPAAIEAFKKMTDMVKVQKITPESSISKSAEDLYQEFTAGQYAMITAAGVRVPAVRSQIKVADPKDIEFMILPGPAGKTYAASPIAGWSVGVWSKSKVKPEAAKFLEFMISKYADELWVKDGGQVPVRKSTITGMKDFFADPSNAYLSVMAKGFAEAGWAQPTSFPIGGWRLDLNSAAQEILSGKTVEAALAASAKAFDERNGN